MQSDLLTLKDIETQRFSKKVKKIRVNKDMCEQFLLSEGNQCGTTLFFSSIDESH